MKDGHRHNPHTPPRLGRIPENLIDAVLDGEVNDRARSEILSAANRHPQQRREITQTTEILRALRTPIEAPDFSDSVVTEAHRRRRFISPRMHRLVTRSRVALAASLLLVLLSYIGASRAWPEAPVFNNGPTPVNTLARSVESDATRAAEAITQTRAQLAPLPTANAMRRVTILPPSTVPTPRLASQNVQIGFFEFPPPTERVTTTRHNPALNPSIRFVGSAAITHPQTLEFDRDSNLP